MIFLYRMLQSKVLWVYLMFTAPPGPPVYAGLGVSDLVETGDLEAVGVAPLALVHEVAKGQHHL